MARSQDMRYSPGKIKVLHYEQIISHNNNETCAGKQT